MWPQVDRIPGAFSLVCSCYPIMRRVWQSRINKVSLSSQGTEKGNPKEMKSTRDMTVEEKIIKLFTNSWAHLPTVPVWI